MFAVRDWAGSLANGKSATPHPEKLSWSDLFKQLADNGRVKAAIEAWKPRCPADFHFLPHSGPPDVLPEGTPERAVAAFLDNWCNSRFGPMSEALLDFLKTPPGKKAGRAREDFGRQIPVGYSIVSVSDEAPSISQVETDVFAQGTEQPHAIRVRVRVVFSDADNNPLVRGEQGGSWKIGLFGFECVSRSPS
jgi:hypothetical protein